MCYATNIGYYVLFGSVIPHILQSLFLIHNGTISLVRVKINRIKLLIFNIGFDLCTGGNWQNY